MVTRRKPYISIIIVSDNRLPHLKACLAALQNLDNAEFVIVNNLASTAMMQTLETYLDQLADPRILFYQSKISLTKNHARNLGFNFASGSWLYFINDYDQLTVKFINFLNHYKLDPRIHFYRLQLTSQNQSKTKFNWFKTKYYSHDISTFLMNAETTFNQFKFQFEDYLTFCDALPLISRLYNIKNVNYQPLKHFYALNHNFDCALGSASDPEVDDSIMAIFQLLLKRKHHWYKQFILLLIACVYREFCCITKPNHRFYLAKIKTMTHRAKIWCWHYWLLGIGFACKTWRLRWRLVFTAVNHKKT